MAELEKVIKGLECWLDDDTHCPDDDCPYMKRLVCDQAAILHDAISLLKAQEPRVFDAEPPKAGNTPTVEELLDALDSVTWYNGISEDILAWKDLPIDDEGSIICPYELFTHDSSKEVIWMICVCLFGEYGTSPRSGWIENVEGFKAFIDEITKTEREALEDQLDGRT